MASNASTGSTTVPSLEYKLILDSRGITYDGTDSGKTPIPVTNADKVNAVYDSKTITFSLYGISFHRKVYEPGHIKAELMLSMTVTPPDVASLTKMLLRRLLSLAVIKDNQETVIAKGYYIHEIAPQYETENGVNKIYVKLDAFSMDKLLTINKFSNAYLGKKLCDDIMSQMASDFKLSKIDKVNGTDTPKNTPLSWEMRQMQTMAYTESNAQVEMIHPYLVQYNESFYDFLKRVTNRCGEFLYYEDGKLCFGLPKQNSATPIKNPARIIYQQISDGPLMVRDFARDTLKEYDATKKTYKPQGDLQNKDEIEKDSRGFPEDAYAELNQADKAGYSYFYNSEVAAEDYYMLLYKDKFGKDRFTDVWWGNTDESLMGMLSDILNSTTIMDLIKSFAKKYGMGAIKAATKVGKANEKGNKLIQKEAVNGSNDYAVMLAKIDENLSHWMTLDYYSDIRCREEEQMRKIVCVDMGTGFQNVQVGEEISLPNNTGTYVVIQVEMNASQSWQKTYEGFVDSDSDFKDNTTKMQSQKFYAIPKLGTTFYPPLLPGCPFPKAGSQPAYVIDSDDPKGQGRVRVRFAWQPTQKPLDAILDEHEKPLEKAKKELDDAVKKLKQYADVTDDYVVTKKGNVDITDPDYVKAKSDFDSKKQAFDAHNVPYQNAKEKKESEEAATPWIRMATPMATTGGGMYFKPEAGDEVMVGFENGNMERPYVMGTLYSKNVVAPDGDRVIVSKNGHTIKMDDPNDGSELLQGIYPGFDFLSSYKICSLSDHFKGLKKGGWNSFLGGIELTDKYGMYKISMSSHERSVSIESPFGNVDINAFTGISINAPNGDISITGKNVEITAHDKLTLNSGKNIKSEGYWKKFADGEAWGKAIADTVVGSTVGRFFDLTLIRSIFEVFIRPIDGTLQIHSNRFLKLEAGKGSAYIPSANYVAREKEDQEKNNDMAVFIYLMKSISDPLNKFVAGFIPLFNAVRSAREALKTHFDGATPDMAAPASLDELTKTCFADNWSYKVADAVDDATEKQIDKKVDRLDKATQALLKYAKTYDHIYDSIEKRTKVMPDKSFKDRVKELFTKVNYTADAQTVLHWDNEANILYKKVKAVLEYANSVDANLFSADLATAEFEGNKKVLKRKLAFQIFERARGNAAIFDSFKVKAANYTKEGLTAPTDTAAPFSDEDWAKYLSGFEFEKKEDKEGFLASVVSGMKDSVMDSLEQVYLFERSVWGPDAKGDILFSNTKDKTIKFEDNGVTKKVANSEFYDSDGHVVTRFVDDLKFNE